MSKKLESQVWDSALPSRLKPLAALLADIASEDGGDIYPSVAKMAWLLGDHDCGRGVPPNERSVQRHLEELIDLGILMFVGWRRNKKSISGTDKRKPIGPGATAEYQMFPNALPYRRLFKERHQERYRHTEYAPGPIGDKMTPIIAGPHQPAAGGPKGDIPAPLKVTFLQAIGDSAYGVTMTPKYDPSLDPSYDPSIEEKDRITAKGSVDPVDATFLTPGTLRDDQDPTSKATSHATRAKPPATTYDDDLPIAP